MIGLCRRLPVTFSLILLMLLPVGCARPPVHEWTDLPAAHTLLKRLDERSGQISRVDLEATVSINRQGRHVSSRQFLLVERPDRIRIDALTGFGQLIMQLATDGETLSVLLNTTEPPRFFTGTADDDSLARFVRLRVAADMLVPVLLHALPIMVHQQRQVTVEGSQLVLALDQEEARQLFYFDPRLQVTGMDYIRDERVLLGVRYADFSARDNFPRRIEVTMPVDEVTVSLKIADVILDPPIPAERFRLQPPPRITVEPLPES